MLIGSKEWQNIGTATSFYQACGFRDFPLPWTAPLEAMNVTLPPGAEVSMLNGDLPLLGSAEQGFIAAMQREALPKGRWQSTTPCFRREPVLDNLRKLYFMKVELINYGTTHDDDIGEMITQAKDVLHALAMQYWQPGRETPSIECVWTDIGWDLTLNGIEIGSYGSRTYQDHKWVYGTGLAEPRFSTALGSL